MFGILTLAFCSAILKWHTETLFSVVVSTDDNALLSFSVDNTVRVWDLMSSWCSAILEGLTDCETTAYEFCV